jgi:hypothetical protein
MSGFPRRALIGTILAMASIWALTGASPRALLANSSFNPSPPVAPDSVNFSDQAVSANDYNPDQDGLDEAVLPSFQGAEAPQYEQLTHINGARYQRPDGEVITAPGPEPFPDLTTARQDGSDDSIVDILNPPPLRASDPASAELEFLPEPLEPTSPPNLCIPGAWSTRRNRALPSGPHEGWLFRDLLHGQNSGERRHHSPDNRSGSSWR